MEKVYRAIRIEKEINEEINIFNELEINKLSSLDEREIDKLRGKLNAIIKEYARCKYGERAESEFLRCQEEFEVITYTMIRSNTKPMSLELYYRIVEDEGEMHALAARYSLGKEKMTKGIIGPTNVAQLNPVLKQNLKSHAIGELIQPFKVGNSWIVARKEAFMPATLDDKVKDAISYRLFMREIEEPDAD